MPNDLCVTLYTATGDVLWIRPSGHCAIVAGDEIWSYVEPAYLDRVQTIFSRCAALREPATTHLRMQTAGGHYGCYAVHFSPGGPPPIAVVSIARHGPDRLCRLSPRELEVAALAAEGLFSKEIASRLHISVSTVTTLMTRARRKLGCRDHADMVVRLSRHHQMLRILLTDPWRPGTK